MAWRIFFQVQRLRFCIFIYIPYQFNILYHQPLIKKIIQRRKPTADINSVKFIDGESSLRSEYQPWVANNEHIT